MISRQFWTDERLKFDAKEVSTIYIISNDAVSDHSMQSRVQQLVVGVDYIKLIWVPDTFFVNEKSAQFHAATQVASLASPARASVDTPTVCRTTSSSESRTRGKSFVAFG